MAAPQISSQAREGFSNAKSYDAYRPSFPSKSVDTLLKAMKIYDFSYARVLEIGAGTGKFTSILAGRGEKFEVVAVEPHQEMRNVLEAKKLGGVKVVEGSATSMEAVEDGWADAVVIAQAFHWFANIDALRSIYRKMVPGAVLGLIWNIEDYNSPMDLEPATAWEHKMRDLIWSASDVEPRFRHKQWHQVFDDQLQSTPATIQAADPLFSLPLGQNTEEWTVWLPSKEAIWNRFSTISSIAILSDSEREETRKKAMDVLESGAVEVNDKGETAVHGRTYAFWTTAIPGAPLKQGG